MIKKGLNPRLAEIGKIKIGGKSPEKRKSKKTGKEYQSPVRFNHFVVTTTEKGEDGNFKINNEIMKKVGAEPKEISIRLPFDSIDMNFYTQFSYYHGNKCLCHGDGEKATRILKDDTEKHIECKPEKCEFLQAEKCKVSGILSCFLSCSMEIGGVYRFRTHSWNSVSNILASLQYFSEQTNGILQGLPLKLKLIRKATREHGNVWVVTVVLDGIEFIRMRELAGAEYKNRMELGINMKQIEQKARETGFLNDTDDPEDIQTEYYPVEDGTIITGKQYADIVDASDREKMKQQKKGDSPEDVKEKIEKKSEKSKKPDKQDKSDKQEEKIYDPQPKDLF